MNWRLLLARNMATKCINELCLRVSAKPHICCMRCYAGEWSGWEVTDEMGKLASTESATLLCPTCCNVLSHLLQLATNKGRLALSGFVGLSLCKMEVNVTTTWTDAISRLLLIIKVASTQFIFPLARTYRMAITTNYSFEVGQQQQQQQRTKQKANWPNKFCFVRPAAAAASWNCH